MTVCGCACATDINDGEHTQAHTELGEGQIADHLQLRSQWTQRTLSGRTQRLIDCCQRMPEAMSRLSLQMRRALESAELQWLAAVGAQQCGRRCACGRSEAASARIKQSFSSSQSALPLQAHLRLHGSRIRSRAIATNGTGRGPAHSRVVSDKPVWMREQRNIAAVTANRNELRCVVGAICPAREICDMLLGVQMLLLRLLLLQQRLLPPVRRRAAGFTVRWADCASLSFFATLRLIHACALIAVGSQLNHLSHLHSPRESSPVRNIRNECVHTWLSESSRPLAAQQ